jgi:hypothetical protein
MLLIALDAPSIRSRLFIATTFIYNSKVNLSHYQSWCISSGRSETFGSNGVRIMT